ncbi:Crp/Fnr family transcriptional regulator [Streptomyces sp. bgisy082]|uniref:Crp/Fnr family transcriptional regulator n=1 Tax=Streptomyces sp. bgisy082 TaxID=3413776 RepID=UPI003D76124E
MDIGGRVPFPDMLPAEERAAFVQLGTRCHYTAGDVLIREGDHEQELIVLHQGVTKVTGRLDGDRVSLMDIRIGGDIVGEVAAVDSGPRSATVTACGVVAATVISPDELEPFLLAYPEGGRALRRWLGGQLRRSDRRRLEFGGYPAPVRLARVLVELAVLYGRQDRNSTVRIDVNLSQSEFAALTGAKTRTVRKALADLRKDGIVTTGCRQTYVRDLPRLRKAARL